MILIRDDIRLPMPAFFVFLEQHGLTIINTGACIEVVSVAQALRFYHGRRRSFWRRLLDHFRHD